MSPACRLDGRLLLLPLGVQARAGLLEVGELALEPLQALGRRRVLLLAQGLALDLELHDAPLDLVELRRQRVDLGPQLRGRLVDEVDGLVGQEAVGDVAVGEGGGGDEGGVLELHAVVDLVALAQAPQDADGVLHRRLGDEHGLESPLEGGVLLDVLPVLVEGGGADGVQLAAREHRLEEVRGVDRALGRARPHHRVQLVDEQDDAALGVGDLLQHRLEAFLELAPVLRARHERPEVEADDALVLQPLGHVAPGDAVGEALDDGGLADPRLADEHGVVLGAPREHLQGAPDLVVASDDGIEPVLFRRLGEVAAVTLERLVLALGMRVGDPLAPAHRGQRLEDLRRGDAVRREQPGRLRVSALPGDGQQEMLGADVVVVQPLGLAFRRLRHLAQARRRAGLRPPVGLRLLPEPCPGFLQQPRRLDAQPPQHRRHHAVRLVDQGDEQMLGLDLRMMLPFRELLRGQHRLLRLLRIALEVHGFFLRRYES